MTGQDYEKVMRMLESVGIDIEGVRRGGNFVFTFYIYDDFHELPIEILDLSERSKNALKRSGIITMQDIAEQISGREDLRRIRNCGAKSVSEIMEKLFLYQIMRISPEKREEYLQECVRKSERRTNYDE